MPFHRRGSNKKYNFVHVKGGKPSTKIHNVLKRRALKTPPNWKNVIVFHKGDKIGTGYDKVNKKQTVYTKEYQEKQNLKKHCEIIPLLQRISSIEKACRRIISKNELTVESLCAVAALLMIKCSFRVGMKRPETHQSSRGTVHILKHDVKFVDGNIIIKFPGKWARTNRCRVEDRTLRKVLRRLHGMHKNNKFLFAKGKESVLITGEDVNAFLRSFAPKNAASVFTSKNIRIINENLHFIDQVREHRGLHASSLRARQSALKEVLTSVSAARYHTVAISKKSYLNPYLRTQALESPASFRGSNADIYMKMLRESCSGAQ